MYSFVKHYKMLELVDAFPDISVENGMITSINLEVIGHFGNCISLNMFVSGHLRIFSGYNNTSNVGYILRELSNLLLPCEDNGLDVIKELHGRPIRLVFDRSEKPYGVCVGIGHFIDDDFVLLKDLLEADYK